MNLKVHGNIAATRRLWSAARELCLGYDEGHLASLFNGTFCMHMATPHKNHKTVKCISM